MYFTAKEWASGEFVPFTWSLFTSGTSESREEYRKWVAKFEAIISTFKRERPDPWQLFCAEVTALSSHNNSILAQAAVPPPRADESEDIFNDFMAMIVGKHSLVHLQDVNLTFFSATESNDSQPDPVSKRSKRKVSNTAEQPDGKRAGRRSESEDYTDNMTE